MENQEMASPMLTLLLLLGVFLIVAGIINKFKNKKMDGAKGYLIAVAILFAINVLRTFNPDNILPNDRSYVLGWLLVNYFFPVLVAFIVSSRFAKKNKAELASSGS